MKNKKRKSLDDSDKIKKRDKGNQKNKKRKNRDDSDEINKSDSIKGKNVWIISSNHKLSRMLSKISKVKLFNID